jgi:uncharacterized protein (TIGR02266 family)
MNEPPAKPRRALKRRNTARIDAEFDVDMTSEHNFFTGFSEDLSEGGVFISTYQPRRIGEHLAIAFRLPGDEAPIRAVVEVKWMREQNVEANVPPGVGASFVDVTPEDRARIEHFVRHRKPLFFEG